MGTPESIERQCLFASFIHKKSLEYRGKRTIFIYLINIVWQKPWSNLLLLSRLQLTWAPQDFFYPHLFYLVLTKKDKIKNCWKVPRNPKQPKEMCSSYSPFGASPPPWNSLGTCHPPWGGSEGDVTWKKLQTDRAYFIYKVHFVNIFFHGS